MAEDLEKPLLGPENFKREGIDLERIPLEEVFEQLRTSKAGLTSEDAEARFKIFGPNKLEEKPENKFLKFLGFMWNPLSWVMEAAAIMAIVLANGGGEGPDWQDFVGIICLLLINSTISFIEENNAGNAAAALMAHLAPKAKVLRDGQWQEQDAAILVPGDIISIKLGDIIPADARLLEGDPLKIDQSALTGESLPVTKKTGDEVFSGSTCKQGEIEAIVIATGVHSFFGKAAHLVDSTEVVGHFQKVLTAIGNFCICSIAVGMLLEIIVMFPVQHRSYRTGIDNLLVLLIGGIPIAMPTVLSVTLAIGSHRLSQQGAITKRMTAIEEMAGMDVLCSDKTGTLTLNRLSVDRNLIEVFNKDIDKDMVVLLSARASRMENQDAIDAAIVNMLADPKEARANIKEVHFFPFNPVNKRTAITYIDADGNWYRASKGAPEQILNLCQEKEEIGRKVHAIIDKFAERGLRSLAVAFQEVPEKSVESTGGPWTFCGLLPLFDPPRHDSAETIRKALHLGVCVKMITGDQLAIAKETGRRLGMGTNMYPSSALLGHEREEHEAIPVDELIEKADGFAGVFPEHKYEIVKILQEKHHICGMTGDGVNDAPALKKADIGIAVSDATDAARGAADLVLTEPGLSVIVSAVLTSRAIFQRMKNYTIYAVSITIRIVLGFTLLTLIWKYDFPPFMVLIIAILNDGTIMTISQDRVKPSPKPDSWKLNEIFAQMDSLCLKAGIHGIAPPIAVAGVGSLELRASNPPQIAAAVGRSSTGFSVEKPSVSSPQRNSPWGFSFRYPLRSLWPRGGRSRYDAAIAVEDAVLVEEKEDKEGKGDEENEGQNGNWVFKILHVRSLWKQEGGEVRIKERVEEENGIPNHEEQSGECTHGDQECDLCTINEDNDEKVDFDRNSFSKLLQKVSLPEARLYARMSYLGNLAYSIPKIKPANLLRSHGLRFVTSSLEKKEQVISGDKKTASAEDHQVEEKTSSKKQQEDNRESAKDQETKETSSFEAQELGDKGKQIQSEEISKGKRISAAAAYQIAASAASYLHSHTKSILPFVSSKSNVDEDLPQVSCGNMESDKMMSEEMASLMATTDSVTAVVAAKEEVKQAVADDLNSTCSSPCEWFICDDDQSGTRFFIIQGSESLASWQANLLFEPIQFEGLDVLVHRGIYEAAKGIYEQMLPEVCQHMKSYGKHATFRFTGHSLGGSLSLLINLMLLIRGEVPSSSLLPVITFGSPAVMCGGDRLLRKLGLPQSHVKSITMHRDIVPRAFSCHYPNHVAEFLKAVNASFRALPCLINQNMLYAPMGQFLILQPDEKFSPKHDLLPSGSGLYLLSCSISDAQEAEKQIQAAQAAFLNSPHPLEILSDRAAYGTGGTIHRDHDMDSYMRSVRNVIRQELNSLRKVRRQHRRRVWWPLVASQGVNAGIAVGRHVASINMSQIQFNFSGILQTGRESLKRFSTLVASQHMHLLVVLSFPARLLILGTHSGINFY